MITTFPSAADMILSRRNNFRDGLLKVIEPLSGSVFIDGRVGRRIARTWSSDPE